MKAVKKTLTITKKVIYFKLCLAIFIVLPVVVFTLLTSKSDALAGMKSFVVVSGSMEPAIPTGSIIYTVPQEFYSDNDIIAYQAEDKTITHRIVDLQALGNELYYTTKGDANEEEDGNLVSRESVIGKTMVFIPYVGRAVMFFKTPQGFFIGIVLPSLIFILMEIWRIKKEIEIMTEKRVLKRLGVVQ